LQRLCILCHYLQLLFEMVGTETAPEAGPGSSARPLVAATVTEADVARAQLKRKHQQLVARREKALKKSKHAVMWDYFEPFLQTDDQGHPVENLVKCVCTSLLRTSNLSRLFIQHVESGACSRALLTSTSGVVASSSNTTAAVAMQTVQQVCSALC
jgi:hypothetical protein